MTRKEILDLIKKADEAYYALDKPIMSDAEYDQLRNEYIIQYGSDDLNYVPGSVSKAFSRFKHIQPVISLAKIKFETEQDKLRSEIERLWPVVHEPKLDGLTIVAYPNKDGSCKFITRGNGKEGELLPNFIGKYERAGVNNTGFPVRGECFIDMETFDKINAERTAEGLELFSNPRNAAAGILRSKERSPYIDRLRYMVYDILFSPVVLDMLTQSISESKKIEMLNQDTVFEVVPCFAGSSIQDEIDSIQDFYTNYSDGIVPIDGIVVKNNAGIDFGSTNHHMKNSFAVKFAAEEQTSILRDIIWQVGRDRLTPVGIFDPVEIDGSIVSRASLHNWQNIERLNLHKNDICVLQKANEIIPYCVSAERNTVVGDLFEKPSVCPCCGAKLEERETKSVNGIEIYCPNPNCDEKIAQNISFIGKKDVLDINGLSIETARKIVSYLKEVYGDAYVTDIFYLTSAELEKLPGFGKKSAANLHTAIQEARKNVKLNSFIKACCISGIGNDIGNKLAQKYHTYENILKACENGNKYELEQIEGIGTETVSILISNDFIDAMQKLREYIKPLDEEDNNKDTAEKGERNTMISGKNFVLTGKMNRFRSEIENDIINAGGKVQSSVNSKTDYLVIADPNSQSVKAKKARSMGVELISEEELYNMIG